MRKSVTFVFIVVCLAYLVGCGGDSSTTTASVTKYDTLPAASVPAPPVRAVMGGAIQGGGALSIASYNVTTFSGTSAGFSNQSTVSSPPAKFNRPIAITTDGTSLFVADHLNNAIRKIDIVSGHDTTIAGSPFGLAGSTDDTGTKASFNLPRDITTDGTSLYVADSGNFTIRKIDIVSGTVTTLAGSAGLAGSIDEAVGTNARFNVINGITTDGASLYVTDSNYTIRRIGLTAPFPVTTVAGTPGVIGSADGKQGLASFNLPNRITTDGPNLYVTDFNNSTIRKIVISTGVVTTIAGKLGPGGAAGSHADSTDGTGETARFNQPNGITTDGVNLYVTDSYDNTVRQIVINSGILNGVYSGPVTTIAGVTSGIAGGLQEGVPTLSRFNKPIGITSDGINLYITDNQNHRIRMIQ